MHLPVWGSKFGSIVESAGVYGLGGILGGVDGVHGRMFAAPGASGSSCKTSALEPCSKDQIKAHDDKSFLSFI